MTPEGRQMNEHILRRFDSQLDKLITRITKMADLVQKQAAAAMRALDGCDVALAREVIEGDDRVDLLDTKIDKLCLRLLALQQPVAIDLRTVLSALSVNRNLERMGDAAVNIAERVEILIPHSDLIEQTHLLEMGTIASEMIREAVQAFLEIDVTIAHSVTVRDSVIDEYDQQNFEILTAAMQRDPATVEAASHLLLVSRNLERMADEATNIAEEAVFVADAKIVKHRGWGRSDDLLSHENNMQQ